MKSVVFLGSRNVRLQETPEPLPGTGEVRLKVLLAGLCATDRHIVDGHFSVSPPRILGHELVGQVEMVGPGVSESWIGKTVGVRPARFCGKCTMCRSGNPQLCLNFECLGNTHDGAYAEFTIARSDQLVVLEEIHETEAVWLEPLACIIQALNQVKNRENQDSILIIGAGTLGILMLQVIRATWPVQIGVVDVNPSKIKIALAQGAHRGWVVPRQGPTDEVTAEIKEWLPLGVPVQIDTSGVPDAIQRAVEWAAPRGQILLFGVPNPAARINLSPQQIFSKELSILASSGMTPNSFDAAITLLKEKRIQPSRLNAAKIPLQDLPAYLLGEKINLFGKILIAPSFSGVNS